jgi:hypothetical protein
MRDSISLGSEIVPRVSDGGRIGHRQKRVKGDLLAGNRGFAARERRPEILKLPERR